MIVLKNSGIVERRNPLINIITRTSNRPNFFKRNHESIINQNYKNIRHIVGYDNYDSLEYLNEYDDIDTFYIKENYTKNIVDIPDPKTGPRFEYNLYFNLLFSQVEDGWILILDDDDHLANEKVITHMITHLKYKTDMLIFQMQYQNKNVIPAKQDLYKKPVIGKIGSPCILIHSSIAKKIKWDGWKCADYRYISKCWEYSERKIWLNVPLINIGSTIGNFGAKNDMKTVPTPTYPSIISKREQISRQLKPLINKYKYDDSYRIYDIHTTYKFFIDHLKNKENFTFLRFGDNDFLHLTGASKTMGALGNNKTTYNSELQHYLLKSFEINDPNYIKTYNFGGKSIHYPKFRIGVPALNTNLLSLIKNNDSTHRFHHVLFFYIMANYYPDYTKDIFSFLKRDNATLYVGSVSKEDAEQVIGHVKTHLKTPATNATTNISKYITQIDNILTNGEYRYIILACGQLSRVLGGYIYEKYKNNYTVIDIGGIIESYNKHTKKRSVLKNGTTYRKFLKMQHKKTYISLSLLPSRADSASKTIQSLLDQSFTPNKIEVYIPKNSEKDPLPDNFKLPEIYSNKLVSVNYVNDIGPVSKLHYSLKKHKKEDCYIITVDDDVEYPIDSIYNLVKHVDENPNVAPAYRGRIIRNGVSDYNMTALYRGNEIKKNIDIDLITGTWGALYHPSYFDESFFKTFTKNDSLFFTDDIWISYNLKKNNITMRVIPIQNKFKILPQHNVKSLWNNNKDGRNNNESLKKLKFFEK